MISSNDLSRISLARDLTSSGKSLPMVGTTTDSKRASSLSAPKIVEDTRAIQCPLSGAMIFSTDPQGPVVPKTPMKTDLWEAASERRGALVQVSSSKVSNPFKGARSRAKLEAWRPDPRIACTKLAYDRRAIKRYWW